MKPFFLVFFVFFASLLPADTIYDIRGESPLLDTNLSHFLDNWRSETITPIREGRFQNIYVNGDTHQKKVALTFDDSPDENTTGRVLDVLQKNNVKAAFFMIASPMEEINATVVKRACDEGHLVLNHTLNHPHLSAIGNDAIRLEIDATSSRIEQICGVYPIMMRPPYGAIEERVMNVLNHQGFSTILWSLDSLDWAIKEPHAIIENVLSSVRPGDIILMHSSRSNGATADALDEIIRKLRGMGYEFVTLEELLGIKAYR